MPIPESPLATRLAGEVSGAAALVHLEALQRIADENGENRASPSRGYDLSVDYVAGVLRAAGWDVSTPTYEVSTGENGEDTPVVVRQVIAQTRTGDPGSMVMAGAHLDSVSDGPGINDNGSGVAALLETAKHLGASPPVRNQVRFAFWGSEEDDLQGSTSYVNSLSSTDRATILLYLNLDMLSSPNAGYFAQGGKGESESETGPPGSAAISRVLVDQLAKTGVAAEIIPFVGDDETAFVEAGIPSGGLENGDAKQKSPKQAEAWGGEAGVDFDRCYHSACDRLDQVNRIALDRHTRTAAGAIAQFAALNGRPSG